MGITVKLLVPWDGYEAGRVLFLGGDTALELIKSGKARVAEWGDM